MCPGCGGRNVTVAYVDGLLKGHCEDCECRSSMVIERTFVVEDDGTTKEVHLPSRTERTAPRSRQGHAATAPTDRTGRHVRPVGGSLDQAGA